jgi:DNA-binding GntR family transcriptional regulator
LKLEALEYKSLSKQATEKLRQEIVTGRIASGEYITEMGLAEMLGVSRIVIREAIFQLTGEGLIRKESNRYTKVVDFSPKDVEDVLDIREAIEKLAGRKSRWNDRTIEELSEYAFEIEKLRKIEDFDQIKLMNMDINFHTKLVEGAGNERLINIWNGIVGQILMLLFKYIQKNRFQSYSHHEIVNALRSRDMDVISTEIKNHLDDTKIMLIEMLSEEPYELEQVQCRDIKRNKKHGGDNGK